MNVSIKQLNFFKNRILQQLEGIRGDIGELRYELYIKMVEACDNIDELKEMCELEMQIDFLNYTKGNIINKLEQENITVRELKEAIDNDKQEYLNMSIETDEEDEFIEEYLGMDGEEQEELDAALLRQLIAREDSLPEEEKNRNPKYLPGMEINEVLEEQYEEERIENLFDSEEYPDDYDEYDEDDEDITEDEDEYSKILGDEDDYPDEYDEDYNNQEEDDDEDSSILDYGDDLDILGEDDDDDDDSVLDSLFENDDDSDDDFLIDGEGEEVESEDDIDDALEDFFIGEDEDEETDESEGLDESTEEEEDEIFEDFFIDNDSDEDDIMEDESDDEIPDEDFLLDEGDADLADLYGDDYSDDGSDEPDDSVFDELLGSDDDYDFDPEDAVNGLEDDGEETDWTSDLFGDDDDDSYDLPRPQVGATPSKPTMRKGLKDEIVDFGNNEKIRVFKDAKTQKTFDLLMKMTGKNNDFKKKNR